MSLLPGFEPSKTNADFRVIKSIEGGCPAMNMEGNLEAGQNPNTYNFTIPSSVPAGDYTLSWTWYVHSLSYDLCVILLTFL